MAATLLTDEAVRVLVWSGQVSVDTLPRMSGLSRQPGRTPRRVREQRAYRLVMAGGTAGVAAVVTAVLAIVGIGSFGIPFALAIVAAVCFFLFRRTVGG
jgi:hypothetical protein